MSFSCKSTACFGTSGTLTSSSINGKIKNITPTPYKGIYDGSIYNDNSMYKIAKDAVATSYRDHIDRQGFKNYSVTYDGIRFRVYIFSSRIS